MSIKQFIKEHKKTIDETICRGEDAISISEFKITNRDRELWVLNDYYLYIMAQSCGVKI